MLYRLRWSASFSLIASEPSLAISAAVTSTLPLPVAASTCTMSPGVPISASVATNVSSFPSGLHTAFCGGYPVG
jgi:hypothetical protein